MPISKRHVLSLRAEEDLIAIWGYTYEQWGEEQATSYIDGLYERFVWLAENPQLGKHRPDIEAGYYCYPQGSHLVFYTISENAIAIIGIPHKAMDFLDYF